MNITEIKLNFNKNAQYLVSCPADDKNFAIIKAPKVGEFDIFKKLMEAVRDEYCLCESDTVEILTHESYSSTCQEVVTILLTEDGEEGRKIDLVLRSLCTY